MLLIKSSPNVNGLQNPVLGKVLQFQHTPNPVVQIHHTGKPCTLHVLTILITYITPAKFYVHVGASHWVCTTSIGAKCGEVLLMDSLASLMSETLILQVAQIYEIPVEKSCLIIPTLDVQQQNGCKTVGCFPLHLQLNYVVAMIPGKYLSSKVI